MFIDKTIRNIKRIRRVSEVLLKYGFEDVVHSTRLRYAMRSKGKSYLGAYQKEFNQNRWERLRLVLEELGPTFIKLGQLLSNRPDILPEDLIKEFEKLQDRVPPFDTEIAREIIEQELKQPIHELFVYFDDKPLGSASIGQVHRARLKTGEDVVVKVQRPEAKKQVQTDLSLIRELIRLSGNYFIRAGILNPLEIVDTFSQSLLAELDYKNEALHLEQFRKTYSDLPHFYVPKPYLNLTTNRVLILEFVSGCKITDVERIKSWGIKPKEIANRGLGIYLSQIFEYGIFHADPHPGNVIVQTNGDIALIDFGMIGKLMRQQRFAFAGIFIAMANKDAKSMAINLRRLAVDHEIEDMRAFEYDLNELIQDYIVLDTGQMTFKDLTGRLQKIAFTYKLQIPGVIFLILRSLSLLEGIGKELDPDFDTLEDIKPFGFKLMAEQFSFQNISNEVKHNLFQTFTLLYNLPIEVRDIVKQVRKGRLVINYKQEADDRLLRKIEVLGKGFILTMIICALIIGASLTFSNNTIVETYTLGGVPWYSLVMYIFAFFFSMYLLAYLMFNLRK
ncbi:MAG TPA: ubiquinone biosynthesis protein [Cytophagales bacterium]|jgi:ubiquinone biosynthesis protein|nr:ubiquinone biosynthesis protein [Cytophagales bacterium]